MLVTQMKTRVDQNISTYIRPSSFRVLAEVADTIPVHVSLVVAFLVVVVVVLVAVANVVDLGVVFVPLPAILRSPSTDITLLVRAGKKSRS